MSEEQRPQTADAPKNSGAKKRKAKGRGLPIRRGALLALLVALLVCACAYALVTGRDIPAVVASIVSVLVHALTGF